MWVPCPKLSPGRVAAGLTIAEATTRELPSACETRKSGRLPSIPVSRTATPTPLPVYMLPSSEPVPFQTLFERIDWL